MIRVRTLQKEIVELPPGAQFLELTDLDGNLAAVAYTGNNGAMHFYQAGDPEFLEYARMMKIEKVVKVLDIGEH